MERIAKGEVLVGPDVAKRLASQCTATQTSAKQLGEIVCERARRLYLGLDSEVGDADGGLLKVLTLTDFLLQQGTDFGQEAVNEIRSGAREEFLSLRSNAKHKDAAEPLLCRLRMTSEIADLLGGGPAASAPAAAAPTADLLGATESPKQSTPAKEADLLGSFGSSTPTILEGEADLLGGGVPSSTPGLIPHAGSGVPDLDPLLAGSAPAPSTGSGVADLDPLHASSVPAPRTGSDVSDLDTLLVVPALASHTGSGVTDLDPLLSTLAEPPAGSLAPRRLVA